MRLQELFDIILMVVLLECLGKRRVLMGIQAPCDKPATVSEVPTDIVLIEVSQKGIVSGEVLHELFRPLGGLQHSLQSIKVLCDSGQCGDELFLLPIPNY